MFQARMIRSLLAFAVIGVSGCASKNYSPSLLPVFMAEGLSQETNPEVSPSGEPAAHPLPAPRVVEPKSNGNGAAKAADETEALPPPRILAGLTLDQAISSCLEGDPKIRAAFEGINQARGDLLTSSLLPNPQYLGDGIFLPLRQFTPDNPGGPPQTDHNFSWSIDWFLFGKRAAAMASGRLGVEVSAADFADQVRQRVAASIAAFYDVLEAQAMADLARIDLDSLKRVEELTRKRFGFGGVGAIEVDRIRLAVIDSQREVRNREKTVAAAKSSLRALIGGRDADPDFRVDGSLDVQKPTQPPAAEEMLALAVQNRPDMESLRRQQAKAAADVRVEQTKACPTVTPAAAYSRQFQSSIGAPDVSSYDVSLTMSVPIFDRNQGNIRKAQATQAQVAYNLQAQLVSLRAEIEQAVADFRVASINVPSDAEQLKAAQSVRDRIEAAYKLGKLTVLDVLDAERAYRDTFRTYILGRSSYWHSLFKLNAAIGKQVLP
jgi:cobalt-zinc-cadmium efflux system outer membrane protein